MRRKAKRAEAAALKPGTVKAGEIASESWAKLVVYPQRGLGGVSFFTRP